TMDVPAPAAGTVAQLRVSIGDRVSKGSVLLVLDTTGADPTDDGQSSATVTREPEPPPAADGAAERDTQVLVLGAGPGGYAAAFRAADLGLRTILVERYERLGGVCLNVGCIPSKALLHAARVVAEAEEMGARGISFGRPDVDVGQLMAWKQEVVLTLTGGLATLAKQRQVEVIRGPGYFTGPHSLSVGEREISFEHCVIAAGSRAAMIPGLPEDPRILDSTGALSPATLPGQLLVIGGGIIGLEMACVYDALGTKVTVVEMLDQLMTGCDPDLVKPLAKRIASRYEGIHLGARVAGVRAREDGLEAEIEGVGAQRFDQILVAVGRVPNGATIGADAAGVAVDEQGFISVDKRLRTNVEHIFAVGDIVGGPMLAHKASHEGKVAAEVIAGHDVEFDARAIPSVAYTDPEVAWMGLTETAARAAGTEYEKAVFPWSASGRALALGRSEGMTKLLVAPDTRRVLGCGIVGVGAGDLIAEAVHAVEMGADAEDLALTVHPHPTLSETVGFAAEMALGTITDLMPPRGRAARGGR
ncbi:MAG: dihydrolipoyl dehydrogenase, partial [Actinomycetota bacterium]|nr:dihydrolipoyl dehydrogenase [Actinomycetota bacterium]